MIQATYSAAFIVTFGCVQKL